MNIFLSYPRADAEIAHKLADDFERAGVSVWIWTKSVPDDLKKVREKRHEMKQQGIEQADVLVALLSPDFKGSIGVSQEIIYAQHRDKPILAVMVRPTEVPFYLLGAHQLDISDDPINGAGRIAQKVEQLSASSRDDAPSEPLSAEELEEGRQILAEESPARVFIAYARAQRGLAKTLSELLIKNGHAVFYDAKIKAGAMWRQTIQRALDDASHLAVLWTPEAAHSDEVEREVSYALAEKKIIIPLLSREIPKLPYHLHSLHYIVLEDDLDMIEQDLLHAIAQFSEDDLWQ
ncbi:MAG: toll/interleukin-1 receptor domain-containing protein [Burkholderiales bacterium]|nr:toll/interleukin-1 receptor domain-containing protein [Anaerolineae bacterium]